MSCKHPGCPRKDVQALDYCGAHYQRFKAGKDMDCPPVKAYQNKGRLVCSVKDCLRMRDSDGLCPAHYQRMKRGKPLGGPIRQVSKRGESHYAHGYHIIKVGGEWIREHRYVMEQYLGRRLYDFENVHHKNGMRSDNRLDNLELWTKTQPCGQRVADLVAFVVETYPEEARMALSLGI